MGVCLGFFVIDMNLSEHEQKEWVAKNQILQDSYNSYRFASKDKQKDDALRRVQMILNLNPLLTYCAAKGADISGIVRHGLDYTTEQCIDEINEIAKNIQNMNREGRYVFPF